jgi:hypothetical protein
MVFVKGTLATLKKGAVMRVVGIPRVNFTLVRWRVEHQGDHPGDLRWSLPYEMIILAAKKSSTQVE